MMFKHQLAHISMYTVTCALPETYYLYEPLSSACSYASGETYKTQWFQREQCHELQQHKTWKKVQSLVSWEAPKHYLTSAMHRWPLSVLKRSTFSFYRSSKMPQGCCFTPGITALEAAAREVGRSCSFCGATNTLLSSSVCLYYESTSACPRGVQMKLQGCSLAPAVQGLALAGWDCDWAHSAPQFSRP